MSFMTTLPSKIFIDGANGTTGLGIRRLVKPLEDAGEISVISIGNHRDEAARRRAFEQADLSILCLPDEAAKDAIALLQDTKTRVIDASSAHRVSDGWVYGFPEMTAEQPNLIRNARFVTNPGCYPTGAIAILRPLIETGIIDKTIPVTVFGVSGYSGGGKNMIAEYEDGGADLARDRALMPYSLSGKHKHVPEIHKYSGLSRAPLFLPHVVPVRQGMHVSVAFPEESVKGGIDAVQKAYEEKYASAAQVRIASLDTARAKLDLSTFHATNAPGADLPPEDGLTLYVTGWQDGSAGHVRVFAELDNLGKGAGAQAVANMRLMLDI